LRSIGGHPCSGRPISAAGSAYKIEISWNSDKQVEISRKWLDGTNLYGRIDAVHEWDCELNAICKRYDPINEFERFRSNHPALTIAQQLALGLLSDGHSAIFSLRRHVPRPNISYDPLLYRFASYNSMFASLYSEIFRRMMFLSKANVPLNSNPSPLSLPFPELLRHKVGVPIDNGESRLMSGSSSPRFRAMRIPSNSFFSFRTHRNSVVFRISLLEPHR
jgi:hypothetical protein